MTPETLETKWRARRRTKQHPSQRRGSTSLFLRADVQRHRCRWPESQASITSGCGAPVLSRVDSRRSRHCELRSIGKSALASGGFDLVRTPERRLGWYGVLAALTTIITTAVQARSPYVGCMAPCSFGEQMLLLQAGQRSTRDKASERASAICGDADEISPIVRPWARSSAGLREHVVALPCQWEYYIVTPRCYSARRRRRFATSLRTCKVTVNTGGDRRPTFCGSFETYDGASAGVPIRHVWVVLQECSIHRRHSVFSIVGVERRRQFWSCCPLSRPDDHRDCSFRVQMHDSEHVTVTAQR